MKKLLSLVCILFVSGTGEIVLANQFGGMDPGAINSQYMRDIRTYDARSRVKQKSSAIVKPKTSLNAQEPLQTTYDIQSIVFLGNNNFSSSQLMQLVGNKINKPMTPETISAIRKDIMKFYQANGFYSAIPIIVSQDNKKGELVIEINEGSKNSITIE